MNDPDLYPDQQRVFDQAIAWLANKQPSRQCFVYEGEAGTGKSVVLAKLAFRYPNSIMCAFAGKSASVLRNRTGLNVTTIHSAIYHYRGSFKDDETGRDIPNFESKEADFSGKLILLDEHGTVGTRLGEDLMATGARVIACGDPYQLRPVRDKRYFDEADAELTEIRRQALESPIIRQAHAVKSGYDYKEDGDDFRVMYKSDLTKKHLTFGGIALCWKNLTRQRLNISRRRAFERGGSILEVGEPVMVLRNDHALRVFNGEIYSVQTRRPQGEDLQVIDGGGRSVVLRNVTVEGIDPEFDERKNEDGWTPVCLAYATTVHKFIGSEEDDVMLIDEYGGNEWQEWVYTGITRAAKRILVVRA